MKERFVFPEGAESPLPLAVAVRNDRAFEVAVLGALRQAVAAGAAAQPPPEILLTPQAADRGRDIVVRGYRGRSLLAIDLGQQWAAGSIYVECKLSGRRRLTLDHAAANVLQLEREPGSIFLLVTNSTLTPRALATIDRQCERLGARFLLVDAWNFAEALPDLSEGAQRRPEPPPYLVSYQILRDEGSDDHYLAHFVLRVVQRPRTRFRIAAHSTRDWKVSAETDGSFELGRGGLATWTLALAPSGPKVPASFSIALTVDGKRRIHEIPLVTRDEMVRLPLFPSDMSRSLGALRERLSNGSLADLTHVHAKAGLGKSRLLRELFEHARRLGIPCRLLRILDHGSVLVESVLVDAKGQQRWDTDQLAALLRALVDRPGERAPLLLVDDAHLLSAEPLEDLFALAAGPRSVQQLIVAGRSDPAFRRPAYEAFVARVAASDLAGRIEQHVFTEMTDLDLRAALGRLFEEHTAGLIGLGGQTGFKPIDLVHAVHSLMERGHVVWTDEDVLRLVGPVEGTMDRLSDQSTLGAVLEERHKHLREIDLGGFSLAAFLEILAAVDNSSFAYAAVERLLADPGAPADILRLWVEVDEALQVAPFRHSSLRDFLAGRFYSFPKGSGCAAALAYLPGVAELEPRKLAACAVASGEIDRAASLILPFAASLRAVRNISSLHLNERDYHDYATLFTILASARRLRPRLLFRCVVARAYLNAHFRAYSLGFIDNLRLLGLVEALPHHSGKSLTLAAIKQLMAHALINGGDSRTALSLMHEVENLLESEPDGRASRAIEFDMCDRLQSFYSHQSAFAPARLFFFRARGCADRLRDPALLNLSFSAEFHLKRYLDVDEAARLAERQYRHAKASAPPRALLHARINCITSEWSQRGADCPPAQVEEMSRMAATCRRLAFGHLVPRLDYLLAVDAFLRWRGGRASVESVDELLRTGLSSARQYGYEDYSWLLASLELLKLVEVGAGDMPIVAKAHSIIEHLHGLGLTFVAGDELCFQNTVVLSNALRALHRHDDQEGAWRAAARISFSPLFLPRPADRARRIEAAFAGQMLNHNYDPRALICSTDGYAIILV